MYLPRKWARMTWLVLSPTLLWAMRPGLLPAAAADDADRDGFTADEGDCDDTRADVHPGADDPEGDGVDQDCGGTNGPEPHVGLSDTSFTRIQDAIDAAVEGATIWVGPGTYREWEISFNGKDITVASTGGADVTTIDGRGQGRCVVFESHETRAAMLSGFTITRGYGERGAGINVYQASPTLEDLVFEGNRAASGGGGFNFYSGSPLLRDSVVKGNQALTNVGGGGKIGSSSGAVLERVTFVRNVSKYEGGGVYASGSQIEMRDIVVKQNTSVKGRGGGVALIRVSGVLGGVEVSGNRAPVGRGGGLYLEETDVLFQGCDIEMNQGNAGGGLYLETSDPSFESCSISFNIAAGDGGGLYLSYSDPNMAGCIINGNVATSGGGAYLAYSSPTLYQCTIAFNTGGIGGGLYGLTSTVDLAQGILLENISALDGGGAFFMGSTVYLSHSLVSFNQAVAGSGGGISSWLTGIEADNVAILDNYAGRSGGGLFLTGTNGHLFNVAVVGNDAPDAGGVYLFSPNSNLAVRDAVFAYNSVDNLVVDGELLAPPDLEYSCLYNPDGLENHNLSNLGASNVTVEPGFLAYDEEGKPADLHLALSSPLIDAGDPDVSDPDGTVSDIGIYGGPDGGGWELDGDGYPDYYWPGAFEDAPSGVSADEYDCDDRNPLVQACE